MDRLLKTALSIPGVLEEYGNPKFGEFLILPASVGTKTTTQCEGPQEYRLTIDGPLFRSQRTILLKLADLARQDLAYAPLPGDAEVLEGLVQLTDEIADQAHDRFGVDCLIEADDSRCECEKPGYYCSGVPGILAHIENGRLAPGAEVERCDLCQRYPSDEAALQKLRELGYDEP